MITQHQLSLKRYELLRRFFHVEDNTTKENSENKNDKLFKIKLLLEPVRQNFLKVEPEEVQCIEEQIIPAKIKRRCGMRQYTPKKIHKYGFQNMVQAMSCIRVTMYFLLYKLRVDF